MSARRLESDRRLEQVYRDLETLNRLIAAVIATARVPGAEDYRVVDEMAASVRFGLEMMVDDLGQVRQQVEQQNRINLYRAEMWRTASDKTLSEKELISRLLAITGECLEMSRACYTAQDGDMFRCTDEWCAAGIGPTLGVTVPGAAVISLAETPLTILNIADLPGLLPPAVLDSMGSAIQETVKRLNLASVAVIPVRIQNRLEGVIALELCADAPLRHPWTDERRTLALELVQIITQTVNKRRMEQAVVASRDELEVRVRERTADLEAANRKMAEHLEEKEVLLKEIHHRVKNNLQTVSSLLSLQARQSEIPGTESMFRDCQTRIKAISLLHEKLYKSDDLAHIDFAPYVERIVNDLYYMYADAAGQVERPVDIKDVRMGVDKAIPCGLIINELVSNAFKYAFPGGRTGTVRVAMELDGANRCRLEVSDTGTGLPEGIETAGGLGMELVRTLVMQLEGEMDITRSDGTLFTIRFPG